jgi:hypothetical protein
VSLTCVKQRLCVPSPYTVIGSVRERLRHEARDHHAVLPRLARTHRVEEAHHHGGEPLLTPVGDRQELVDRLGAGVAPPPAVRGAHHQVAALAERDVQALAVHLRGGGDEHPPPLLGRQLQQQLGALDVGLDRPHRALHDELDAPTAAARWKIASASSTSSASSGLFIIVSMTYVKRSWLRRWAMLRNEPVERSSMIETRGPSASSASARWEPMKPAPPVMRYFMTLLG